MNKASTFALALVMGAVGITGATPGIAAKKEEKAPAGPAPKLGKEFRAAIGAAQTAIKAGNAADGQAKLTAAEALAQAPDEKFYVGAMRFEIYKLTKDSATGRRALQEMLSSQSPLMANAKELSVAAGQLAYQAADYPKAIEYFNSAEAAGANGVDLHLLAAESNFKLNLVPAGLTQVERAIAAAKAAGQKPSEDWYRRAASVAYKAKLSGDVAKWTRAQVQAFPTAENWRSALVTYRDSAKLEGQQQLDLMRLMRLTKSLAGERDFYEYASLATERALPGEAKAAIEEGYASGAVQKTSRAVGEMLTIANGKIAADRASLAASEKQAGSAPNGKTAKGSADGYLGYGEDAKAIALYQTALQKGGVDNDEVNTRLGIAYARTGQKDLARQAFSKVVGPRAEIARFWTLYLDTLA